MSEHTPGPWKYCETIPSSVGILILSEKGALIGTAENAMLPFPEITANARLLASAPDLLQALKSAIGTMEEMAETSLVDPDIQRFYSVLRKVEGRTS